MKLAESTFRRLSFALAFLAFFTFSVFSEDNGIISLDEPSSGATISHTVMHVAPLVNLDGNWGFEADFHVRFDIGFFYMGFGLLPKFEELSEYSNFKAYPEGFIGGGLFKEFSGSPVSVYALASVGVLHREGNLFKSIFASVVEYALNSLLDSREDEWIRTKSFSKFNADLRGAFGLEYDVSEEYRGFCQVNFDLVLNWDGAVGVNKTLAVGIAMNL